MVLYKVNENERYCVTCDLEIWWLIKIIAVVCTSFYEWQQSRYLLFHCLFHKSLYIQREEQDGCCPQNGYGPGQSRIWTEPKPDLNRAQAKSEPAQGQIWTGSGPEQGQVLLWALLVLLALGGWLIHRCTYGKFTFQLFFSLSCGLAAVDNWTLWLLTVDHVWPVLLLKRESDQMKFEPNKMYLWLINGRFIYLF